jgi:hypothetical protein
MSSVYTHHSHVKCEDCGERHFPGNSSACIEVLKEKIQYLEQELRHAETQLEMEGR